MVTRSDNMGGECTGIWIVHKGRYVTHTRYPEGEPRTPLRFVPVRSPLYLFSGIFRSFRQAEAASADRRVRFEEMAERQAALSRFRGRFARGLTVGSGPSGPALPVRGLARGSGVGCRLPVTGGCPYKAPSAPRIPESRVPSLGPGGREAVVTVRAVSGCEGRSVWPIRCSAGRCGQRLSSPT